MVRSKLLLSWTLRCWKILFTGSFFVCVCVYFFFLIFECFCFEIYYCCSWKLKFVITRLILQQNISFDIFFPHSLPEMFKKIWLFDLIPNRPDFLNPLFLNPLFIGTSNLYMDSACLYVYKSKCKGKSISIPFITLFIEIKNYRILDNINGTLDSSCYSTLL